MRPTRAGSHYAHSLSEWKLKRSFGGFLVFVSVLLLLKLYLHTTHAAEAGWLKVIVLFLTGIFAGFLSGMLGVGGGTIMVPAMVLFAGYDQYTAQGSSLLTMVPAGALGAYAHWRLGNVRTNILKGIISGILVGTYLGGTIAILLPQKILRYIFAAALIWTGVRYLVTKRSDVILKSVKM